MNVCAWLQKGAWYTEYAGWATVSIHCFFVFFLERFSSASSHDGRDGSPCDLGAMSPSRFHFLLFSLPTSRFTVTQRVCIIVHYRVLSILVVDSLAGGRSLLAPNTTQVRTTMRRRCYCCWGGPISVNAGLAA